MRGPTTLALFALPGVAVASPVWYAALPPAVEPEAAPEIVDRLHDALVTGFSEGGRPCVPAADVRTLLSRRADLAACREGPCVRDISVALKVRRLVRAHVVVLGKNYQMQVDLLGGGSGRVLASQSGTCDICTMSEAETALLAVATEVASNTPPWPAARRVPVERPKTAGAAATATKRTPAPKTGWARFSWSEHPHAWVAAGAGLIGAAAIAGGSILVSRHGDCAESDGAGNCKELRNGGALGAALIGAGVVAFSGAAIAIWRGNHPKTNKRVFAAPSSGGGMAGAILEF